MGKEDDRALFRLVGPLSVSAVQRWLQGYLPLFLSDTGLMQTQVSLSGRRAFDALGVLSSASAFANHSRM